ncbi:MAG TPA: TraR/DksA family transcriptional regulator [Candidatus Binatia bacterium]|jgi:DnaK suppressor protein|nr:TraR/DksA family transcriptional regulator [Candidatus Binatia bacterium]
MRKAFLKKARETLEGLRGQLLRNVRQDLNEVRDASKDEGMDTYDLASDARDREISLILTDRDRDKVQGIDEALSRVDDGTYGVCESCESEIAEARLVALPFTRLCVNCQGERERELKMNRRFEEDRSFRRLGGGESDEEGS